MGLGHRSLALSLVVTSLACVVEDPPGPPGKNMTGPVTTLGTSASDTGNETGSPDDLPGCDPLAPPEDECGVGMRCDLTSGVCVPATGDGLEGDPCVDDDQCTPGLICVDDRCRSLCDAELGDGCEADRVCVVADAPIPGLCLARCDLVLDDCLLDDEACKRVVAAGDALAFACAPNPGAGLSGDACEYDTDCAPAHLCTPSNLHVLPCANDAASCCAPVCDTVELLCFGLEPICYALGIPGQESAGFCGAE